MRVDVQLVTAGTLALVLLGAACAGSNEDGSSAATTAGAVLPPSASAKEICLNGVHRSPRENIRVERALATRLFDVKRWVLAEAPEIEWDTFSSSLARAPLDEKVGLCVLSKVDGSRFTHPPGVNTPKPTKAVVLIVRLNGASTLFLAGSTGAMLSVTPASVAGLG